ncbi:MAG: enoyl-CoA hydratase-related protein, partial [Actinomycetota bacterium]|nr:enoyl-CoA hydratase-related protein [Actinomycetota bacterium]
MTEHITVHVDGDRRVATLTLDQPDRRNSLTLAMVAEIVAAVDDLEARDDVGALVVTGAGSAFCAGADLGHLGASRESGLRDIYEGFL